MTTFSSTSIRCVAAGLPRGCLLTAVMLLAGCEKQEQVTTYSVPKHESLQSPEFSADAAKRKPRPERMLAAIAPHGSDLWFFKLQGPLDAVAARDAEFRQFLKSLRFSSADKIEWTLPENWQEKPGNEMRHATLVLSGKPPLEVSVTTFPAGEGDATEKLLANVNRWRGQLDLPRIEAEDLPSRAETLKVGELTVTLVNYVGKVLPKSAMPGGMMPPMAGRANPLRNPPAVASDDETGVKFDKPAEWTQVAPKQFQLCRFEVQDGQQRIEIGISQAGGDRSDNINRWRRQVGLGPLSDEELKSVGQSFKVGSRQGELIELTANETTLVGVMIPDGDQSWFIKLSGDAALAAKERSRFETFAKSLKFE